MHLPQELKTDSSSSCRTRLAKLRHRILTATTHSSSFSRPPPRQPVQELQPCRPHPPHPSPKRAWRNRCRKCHKSQFGTELDLQETFPRPNLMEDTQRVGKHTNHSILRQLRLGAEITHLPPDHLHCGLAHPPPPESGCSMRTSRIGVPRVIDC